MQQLKVCFVGVGSIAKRHIKNLRTICIRRGIELTIDAFSRREKANFDGVDHIFRKEEDLPPIYDAVFITNPTEMHLDTLKRFEHFSKSFFIEKPVVSPKQIVVAKSFLPKPGILYYVACPLRYNSVIQYVKKNIDPHDVISIRSISSSYLPDWRPGVDYRGTYSAKKELGGGVSIDLIHEWDYLCYLFGFPEQVQFMIGKKSNLEIDSEDYAIYLAEYPDKIAELHLDYFGRKTIRKVELITKTDTIIGDIANNKLSYLVSGVSVDFHEERDDYQCRELEHFLDMATGLSTIEESFFHAIEVLELTQGNLVCMNDCQSYLADDN